jgi:hypothetical protein
MIELHLKVINLGEATYLPAPEQGEPEGLFRRVVTFRTMEYDETERDEIIATLWDDMAFLDLNIGDELLATIQFKRSFEYDGSSHQIADVIDIKKLTEYDDTITW